jgi:hypothetical protein
MNKNLTLTSEPRKHPVLKVGVSDKSLPIYKVILFIEKENFDDENRKNLSLKLADTMISCKFNDVNCKPIDFVWHFSPGYGNCYSFNSGCEKVDLKQTFFTGSNTKFKLQIYVNFHESLSQFNLYYGDGLGALVIFTNNPHLSSNKKKVYLPSGLRSVISLDRSFKFSLPKPRLG